MPELEIRAASADDVPLILSFIKELAEYERLSHEVVATEEVLRDALFGERPVAEVLIGHHRGEPVGFALFFYNFSTFLGKPGIYLEDLYVRPRYRGLGFGKTLLRRVAELAKERGCGRLEWSVLDWNEAAIRFYKTLGAVPMDEWTIYRISGEALDELAARCGSHAGSRLCADEGVYSGPESVDAGREEDPLAEGTGWRSFWDRLFSDQHHSEREERVIEYIVHRLGEGASLQEIVREEYVRRNASPVEVEEICSKPEMVQAARGHMERDFSSEELDPRRRPG